MKKENAFKRNVCFTFFEDYRLTAKDLEADFGKEIVADYYNAIIDYALYGNEPDLKGALKYIWHTTKSTIDKSIERRSNGFTRENTKQTEIIKDYKKNHPNATQREISEATGISIGKVNKVLKNNKDANSNTDTITNSNSNTITNTTTSNEREREHNREHVSLDNINNQCKVQNEPIISDSYISTEKKKELINLYKPGCKIWKIAKEVGLEFDDAKKIIDEYLSNPKEYFYESPKQNRLTFSDNSYIDTKLIRDIIDENGYDIKSINEDLEYYYTKSINDGIDRDEVINFFKIFNYTIENGYQEKEIEKPDYDVYNNFEDIEDLIVV